MGSKFVSLDESIATVSDVVAEKESRFTPTAIRLSVFRYAERARIPVTVSVSLAVFGLQAIHSILLARLFGPVGRGEYGTVVFYAQTMIYIGLMGTHYSIARCATQIAVDPSLPQFYPPKKSRNSPSEARSDAGYPALQRTAFRVGAITGVLSMLFAMALCWIGLPESKQYLMPLCLVCTLMLPAEHLRLTAQAVDHGRGEFARYNLSRLFAATIFPVFVMVLVWLPYRNLQLVAWLTVIVSMLAYLFYWLISDTRNVWSGGRLSAWRLVREAFPDGILVLANVMYERLAILLVIWGVSFADQGYYLTALPIATLLMVAPNAIELFAFRAAANPNQSISMKAGLRAAGMVCAVQMLVLLLLQFSLTPLVLVLFGEAFREAIPVARILIFAMAFSGLTIVGEGYLRGRQMASVGVYTRVVAVIVMLVSAVGLTSTTPLLRIAIAVTIGQVVNVLLIAAFLLRDVKLRNLSEDGEGQ